MKKSQKKKKKTTNTTIGTLSVHAKGFGFVIPKKRETSVDIFIPKDCMNGAIDKDIVEVKIDSIVSPKGPSGSILAIIERIRKHITATVIHASKKGCIAYIPMLPEIPIRFKTKEKLVQGDRILLKIPKSDRDPSHFSFIKKLGSIKDPSIDIDIAIEDFQIKTKFAKEALEQAKELSKQDPAKATNRKDLTDLDCITIDPKTAKDFDDALSLTIDKEKNYHLGVHIADVAHYIQAGSSLDNEAYSRGNSTYFPGNCIPMLPEELSNDLCSLKPNVVRLCVSVLMDFDKQGKLYNYQIVRSKICSKMRFTYSEASKILQSKTKEKYQELLENLAKLALILKKQRFERGSIDFSLSEARIEVDEKGEPQKVTIVPYDISHQLVEEFMLKANEMVAHRLEKKNKMLIYRIHEKPAEKNFEDFINTARALGFHLPDAPSHQDIQNVFCQAKDKQVHQFLSLTFIKNMKLALYSPDNIGHYGLSLIHYCHFTSPIRRYSDLIIQRLLFDEEGKDLDLKKIAENCSNLERRSMQGENSIILLKKLRLLHKWYLEDPHRIFAASITQIKPFGIFFEVKDIFLEGFIHISDLNNDYFIFEPHRVRLVGERTNLIYKYADMIDVQLSHVDLIKQEAIWHLP